MFDEESLRRYVLEAMPGASVQVHDMTGTRDHFEIEVVSEAFEGQSLLERHRALHRILEGPMAGAVHAVKFKAFTPTQKSASSTQKFTSS